MSRVIFTRSVPSLISLCTDFIVNHLEQVLHRNELAYLPVKLKDKILRRFVVSQHFWRNVNFKWVLKMLVHPGTRSLNLTLITVDDEILEIISVCAGLQELFLTQHTCNTVSTNGLLKLFPHLPNLYMLRLSRCFAVDDTVVSCLATNCKKLAGVDLNSCTYVTSDSVSELANLDQLQWVTLSNTNVCDDGIQNLVLGPSGKRLKELRLNDCSKLSNNVLQMIVENCKSLEVLVFNDCSRLAGDFCFGYEDTELMHLKQVQWTIPW